MDTVTVRRRCWASFSFIFILQNPCYSQKLTSASRNECAETLPASIFLSLLQHKINVLLKDFSVFQAIMEYLQKPIMCYCNNCSRDPSGPLGESRAVRASKAPITDLPEISQLPRPRPRMPCLEARQNRY